MAKLQSAQLRYHVVDEEGNDRGHYADTSTHYPSHKVVFQSEMVKISHGLFARMSESRPP